MNKQVLIEKLNLTYSWLEHIISKLSHEELTQEKVQGERTVKDILAHIAAWNRNGIEWIESIAKGERPILPMEGYILEERPEVFARLNEDIQERNEDLSVKTVLDEHYNSWRELILLVETLTQEDLNRTFEFEWIPNPIPGWNIVAWRIGHADNHGKHIEAWIERKPE